MKEKLLKGINDLLNEYGYENAILEEVKDVEDWNISFTINSKEMRVYRDVKNGEYIENLFYIMIGDPENNKNNLNEFQVYSIIENLIFN